ncbi:MAG: HNH endonuclease [Nitrososphaerales archaeon]
MSWKYSESDFDYHDSDAAKKTRQRFEKLKELLAVKMVRDPVLKDFVSTLYVPRAKVRSTGELRKVSWVGFSHKKFPDPRTGIEFQFGTGNRGSAFFGIWIQGDSATSKARKAAHLSLRRFTAADLVRRFSQAGANTYLWFRADRTARWPGLKRDEWVTDLDEDLMEDFLTGLGKRRLWVDIGEEVSKKALLRLDNVEKAVMDTTRQLLPIYNLLAGITPSPKGAAPQDNVGALRPSDEFDGERKELQKASIPRRSEAVSQARRRIGQELVRQNAERNYPQGCAMCKPRIALRGLLIASHIKDWAKSKRKEKYDDANVLMLCALHDELFERGYVVAGDDLKILYSPRLSDPATLLFLRSLAGDGVSGWKETPPGVGYLAWHRMKHAAMGPFMDLDRLLSEAPREEPASRGMKP